ncbi:MAG: biotin carboxylase N-terminal domain-containing protein [Acidimicrobiales bacterium]
MSPTPVQAPSSILVANRGEIASRIFRTARAMGMRCVAVFTDADTAAPYVQQADTAVRLVNGYLDIAEIVDAASRAGAEAIHPGYGFLAENPAFAEAVVAGGITWIGPPAEAIRSMGDKLAAKEIADNAGVPTLPSTDDPEAIDAIGYPLLIKAVAGGGGKGMRIVEAHADLEQAIAAARREALASFGDDRVFFERYVPRARHIEIQILGDCHGEVLQLGERECSIQRRHQKIIEESPSPVVDAALRGDMGEAAIRMARAMEYESAGTVEFLVEDDSHDFYFLEVNTRLQVEHPVTEEVTGIDLVREQLRIAAGEPLGYDQGHVQLSGHAIEARLYAEDPATDFLPATGTLAAFAPAVEPAVRWDSGVTTGSIVGIDFDPMLAKVISHAPTRPEAAARLARALERLHIGGVTTNRDFLAHTLRTGEFLSGDTTTDFIERVNPIGQRELSPVEAETIAVAGAMWIQERNRATAGLLQELPSGFRNARLPPQRTRLDIGGQDLTIDYRTNRDGTFAIESDGEVNVACVHSWNESTIEVEWQNVRTAYRVTASGDQLWMTGPTGTTEVTIAPRFRLPVDEVPTGAMLAPMPGVVLDVQRSVGDDVTKGETLVILEAMKMEHHIRAPGDGTVAEISVGSGEQVVNGQLLVVIRDHAAETNDSDGQR